MRKDKKAPRLNKEWRAKVGETKYFTPNKAQRKAGAVVIKQHGTEEYGKVKKNGPLPGSIRGVGNGYFSHYTRGCILGNEEPQGTPISPAEVQAAKELIRSKIAKDFRMAFLVIGKIVRKAQNKDQASMDWCQARNIKF